MTLSKMQEVAREEDLKLLAENFHFHDSQTPQWLGWLEDLLCPVCRYQRAHLASLRKQGEA